MMYLIYEIRYQYRKADGTDVLQDIVFTHPDSYAMVNTYPQVLIIDTTYKTTMYDMPLLEAVGATSTDKTFTIAYAFMSHETTEHFEFILRFIRGMYEHDTPNVVVTDRALAMMSAVDKIFPESQKHLCRRHIEQCVLLRAIKHEGFDDKHANTFKGRWNSAISASTVEEWEVNWRYMQKKYKKFPGLISYCEETWLEAYGIRILGAYLDWRLHYGNYTTNRYSYNLFIFQISYYI